MTIVVDASVACKWFFEEPLAEREHSRMVTADRAFFSRVADSPWKHRIESLEGV